MEFTLLRYGCFYNYYAAHCIATVFCRVRAVQHFYLGNFTGGNHGPARRATPARLQVVVQWHTIGKHHGTRSLKHIGTAYTHSTIGVANKTATNNNARLKFNHIFCGCNIYALKVFTGEHAIGGSKIGLITRLAFAPHFHFFNIFFV